MKFRGKGFEEVPSLFELAETGLRDKILRYGNVLIKVLAPFCNAFELFACAFTDESKEFLMRVASLGPTCGVTCLYGRLNFLPGGGCSPLIQTFPEICNFDRNITKCPSFAFA